jgi:hypothetical protein
MSLIIAQVVTHQWDPGIRGSQLGKYEGAESGDFSLANMLEKPFRPLARGWMGKVVLTAKSSFCEVTSIMENADIRSISGVFGNPRQQTTAYQNRGPPFSSSGY